MSTLGPRRTLRPDQALRWRGVDNAGPPPRGIPPVVLQPSLPNPMGPDGRPIALPGANYPPAGAVPVDVSGDANIAPGASATLVTFQVPDTTRFRMAGIGFGADDEAALRFLTWSIRSNTDPVSGYVGQTAAVGSIRTLANIFVLVGASAAVTIVGAADAAAGVTFRYICRMQGWLYTEKE